MTAQHGRGDEFARERVSRYVQGARNRSTACESRSGMTRSTSRTGWAQSRRSDKSNGRDRTLQYDQLWETDGLFRIDHESIPVHWARMGHETGLYYYRARYYDPTTGRFLSEDPVGFIGGSNLYDYADNNSISQVDPIGLLPRVPWNRIRARDCNPTELAQCTQMCGSKGVQSCKVVQQFRITRVKDGKALWKWADGPMSCSCNDPEDCPNAEPHLTPPVLSPNTKRAITVGSVMGAIATAGWLVLEYGWVFAL